MNLEWSMELSNVFTFVNGSRKAKSEPTAVLMASGVLLTKAATGPQGLDQVDSTKTSQATLTFFILLLCFLPFKAGGLPSYGLTSS